MIDFEKMLRNVASGRPLVHAMTNYVTVNDCANVILAGGASPIMADDIDEVEEITSLCSALVINIGTLNKRTIDSFIKAGKEANRLGRPVVLDPVGAGASSLRTDTVTKLMESLKFDVIRGNMSEIRAISGSCARTRGVDADDSDMVTIESLDEAVSFAKRLSGSTGSVIAITGPIDIVADSNDAYAIRNGHESMSRISGTGCMLAALVGAFCGANPDKPLHSAAAATCMMGLAGEMANESNERNGGGVASLKIRLIDSISLISGSELKEGALIEKR
jgi:hydroxyethylthiazole kinase